MWYFLSWCYGYDMEKMWLGIKCITNCFINVYPSCLALILPGHEHESRNPPSISIMFSCSCIAPQGLNSTLTYEQTQALTLRDLSMTLKQKFKALTPSRKDTLVPISVLGLSSCVEANLLIFWLSIVEFCSSGQCLGVYYSPSPAKYFSPNTNYLLPCKNGCSQLNHQKMLLNQWCFMVKWL